MPLRFTCPHCDHAFAVTKMPAGKLRCPGCEERFVPKRNKAIVEDVEEDSGSSRGLFFALALGGALLLLVVGGLLASKVIMKAVDGLKNSVASNNDGTVVPAPPDTNPPPTPVPTPNPNPNPNPDPTPAPPKPDPARERQARVNSAIDKGVIYLRKELRNQLDRQKNKAADLHPYIFGVVAFAALTLIESGVPASDPLVQETLALVRSNAGSMNYTYQAAPTIMLLDKSGDARDRDTILQLGTRIVSAQRSGGDWTYDLLNEWPAAARPQLEQQLFNYLRTVTLKTPVGDRRLLAQSLTVLPIVRWINGAAQTQNFVSDNSNTQFAVLALWVAQRHGLPALPSLAMAAQHFRRTQKPEGSWTYSGNQGSWTASMTCAALLGLGIGTVLEPFEPGKAKPDALDRTRDPVIEKAFGYLSDVIRDPAGTSNKGGERGKIIQADAHGDLYFLWTLERVAVLFGIDSIGGQNWYDWASDIIVKAQKDDGSWQETHPGIPDTCFALLVLKRVNIVQDVKIDANLTGNIKKAISIKDKR